MAEAKDVKRRLSLVLGSKDIARLDRLEQLTEASATVDVIRNALRLYEALIDETEQGNKLVRQTPDGRQIEMPLFW